MKTYLERDNPDRLEPEYYVDEDSTDEMVELAVEQGRKQYYRCWMTYIGQYDEDDYYLSLR